MRPKHSLCLCLTSPLWVFIMCEEKTWKALWGFSTWILKLNSTLNKTLILLTLNTCCKDLKDLSWSGESSFKKLTGIRFKKTLLFKWRMCIDWQSVDRSMMCLHWSMPSRTWRFLSPTISTNTIVSKRLWLRSHLSHESQRSLLVSTIEKNRKRKGFSLSSFVQ